MITDNTDTGNWSIRDNNSSRTSWQTAITLNNVAFWNNKRAGTIIMIWNRPITSGGTPRPSDFNKNDGYIELDASNIAYFGGTAGLDISPAWGGSSLNFAGNGDIVELRTSSTAHVHGLGHASSPGTEWTAMSRPKLNHSNNASSSDAI